jgi:XTP/dITP diphosphohydrolase
MPNIRFLSGNRFKIDEVQRILGPAGYNVIAVSKEIHEIQTEDGTALVRDKVLRAFTSVGKPIFVEHTGLYLQSLNGLPGGLTRIFWDRLEADAFFQLTKGLSSACAVARTIIGYCDGRVLHYFDGEIEGTITSPAGPRDFQWDCIFTPKGHSLTFAEMGDEKHNISMRKLALQRFATFLSSQQS